MGRGAHIGIPGSRCRHRPIAGHFYAFNYDMIEALWKHQYTKFFDTIGLLYRWLKMAIFGVRQALSNPFCPSTYSTVYRYLYPTASQPADPHKLALEGITSRVPHHPPPLPPTPHPTLRSRSMYHVSSPRKSILVHTSYTLDSELSQTRRVADGLHSAGSNGAIADNPWPLYVRYVYWLAVATVLARITSVQRRELPVTTIVNHGAQPRTGIQVDALYT